MEQKLALKDAVEEFEDINSTDDVLDEAVPVVDEELRNLRLLEDAQANLYVAPTDVTLSGGVTLYAVMQTGEGLSFQTTLLNTDDVELNDIDAAEPAEKPDVDVASAQDVRRNFD